MNGRPKGLARVLRPILAGWRRLTRRGSCADEAPQSTQPATQAAGPRRLSDLLKILHERSHGVAAGKARANSRAIPPVRAVEPGNPPLVRPKPFIEAQDLYKARALYLKVAAIPTGRRRSGRRTRSHYG